MRLYHGSTLTINEPKIINHQKLVDFGKGFYTTTSKLQAENWANLKSKRLKTNLGMVSVFEFDENLLKNKLFKTKKFNFATEEWLDFVILNRTKDIQHDYDIVKGPVANDTLYATLSLYESGFLSKQETIERLKTHKLHDQISFHTSTALEHLIFINSYQIA